MSTPHQFTLTLRNGETVVRTLREGTLTVGRASSCDVSVQHPSVSRVHARLTISAAGCRVTDLDSSNGTFVNGTRVTELAVRDGDRITFGELNTTLSCPPPPTPTPIRGSQPPALQDIQILNQPGTVLWRIDAPASPSAGLRARDPQRLIALLSQAANLLMLHGSLSDILGRVVDLAVEHLSAERAVLMLKDASGALTVQVQRPEPERHAGPPISRTVAQMVMTERVAFLAEDAAHHDLLHQAESVIMRRVQSLMCAPLWHEQRVSGVLYLEDGERHKFNAADLEILVSLSNHAAVAIERSLLHERLLAAQRHRERLERYHSPAVIERILGDADRPDAHGSDDGVAFQAQERQVTVLFADLVGFTALAEAMPANEVARLLNAFFADMSDAIFEQDGTLDKFIGDGLLAVFGAPLPQPDHAARAVAAAIAMQRRLRERNRLALGPALTMRIGLSTGPVVAGDIGSPRRRDYTVLGDTVNTASRLESSVAQPGQIVLTRVTLDHLPQPLPLQSLGMIPLRGRRQAVEVFAIIDQEHVP